MFLLMKPKVLYADYRMCYGWRSCGCDCVLKMCAMCTSRNGVCAIELLLFETWAETYVLEECLALRMNYKDTVSV